MASEWKQARLGDICEVVRGGSPRPIIDYITDDEDGVNWLKIGDVKETDKYFTHANERIKRSGIPKTREVKKGDLILSNSMSFGRAFITLIDGYIHDGWLRLRCDEHVISKEYLYYFLISSIAQNQFKAVATGSVVNNLKSDTVKDTTIVLPPMSVQKQIVAALDALDQKIVVNQKINDNLQQQAATIFHRWFVNNPDSEKWPMVTLDDLTSLVSRGIAPKYDDDSAQIVLNQKCIRDHYIDISLGRRHKPKVINEKWLQYGDLLINSTGEGTLGRAAQVWFIPENMTVDSHVTVVRPMNQLLLFYTGLWGISHEREIEALHTGSTGQTELPCERVKAMELRLPDNDTLVRFNAVIAPMVSAIIANQKENTCLASIRDALLPKLMSGEIDVSGIDI